MTDLGLANSGTAVLADRGHVRTPGLPAGIWQKDIVLRNSSRPVHFKWKSNRCYFVHTIAGFVRHFGKNVNPAFKYGLLVAAMATLGLPATVRGSIGKNEACSNCHDPGTISVTTNLITKNTAPGATFSLTANWTGGSSSSGAKWPTAGSGVGNNSLFNPTPVSKTGGATGSFTANFTAPATTGNYSLVVFAATTGPECDSQIVTVTVTGAKSNGTVTLGNLTHTYNGTAKSASATTTPAGMNVTFTYNGSASAPVNAGNYTVIATINNTSYQGTATGQFVISKANATVILGNLAHTYNGTAKSASATTNPPGLTVTFTYNGTATAPTNVGSYNVAGTISNANYQGSANGTLVISAAPSPLADFRAANGLASNGSQDLLIPAGDGVTNLEKYAFNMIGNGTGQAGSLNIPNHRPVGPNGTSGLPSLEVNVGNSTLTYIRRKASTNPGITYVVEYSDTLAVGSWAAYAPASQTPTSIDANYERVALTDSVAIAPKRFFRVRITTP